MSSEFVNNFLEKGLLSRNRPSFNLDSDEVGGNSSISTTGNTESFMGSTFHTIYSVNTKGIAERTPAIVDKGGSFIPLDPKAFLRMLIYVPSVVSDGGNTRLVVQQTEYQKKLPQPDFGVEVISDREYPPLWVRKLGDVLGYGIYGALSGSDMISPFVSRSKSLLQLDEDLNELNRRNGNTHPSLEHVIQAYRFIGNRVARFFDTQDAGRKSVNIFEPRFQHTPKRFKKSAAEIDRAINDGEIDSEVVIIAGEPYALTDKYLDYVDGLSQDTLHHLRLYAGPGAVVFNNDNEEFNIVNQGIRPDFLRFSYADVPENSYLQGLLDGLEQIKKGDGVSRNLLDFPYWVDELINVNGEQVPANTVVRRALQEVLAGNLTLSINEVKNHINGHYYMTGNVGDEEAAEQMIARVKKSNSKGKSPRISMKYLHRDLGRDVGATSLHLFNFAMNFMPELQDPSVFEEFARHVEFKVIEARHRLVKDTAHSTIAPYPDEIGFPRSEFIIYQLKYKDLVTVWSKRKRDIIRRDEVLRFAERVRSGELPQAQIIGKGNGHSGGLLLEESADGQLRVSRSSGELRQRESSSQTEIAGNERREDLAE